MLHSKALRQAWEFMYWPQQHWVRKNMIRLEAEDFTSVPPRVNKSLNRKACALAMSTACELGGNRLRQRQRVHPSGFECNLEKYHQLSTSSLVSDFGRQPITCTATSDQCRANSIPASTFTVENEYEHSLGEAIDALGQPATWLTLSPEHRRHCFLHFASFCKLKGDVSMLQRTWHSCLACPGHLLFKQNGEDDQEGLALYAIAVYVLMHSCRYDDMRFSCHRIYMFIGEHRLAFQNLYECCKGWAPRNVILKHTIHV